jgi:hypothetical protein
LDQYGLVFRAPDNSSGMGYYFTVSCDGRFGLMRWNTDNTQPFILNWGIDSNINPGSNQTNRLGVYVKGSSIRLYMNGKQIAETTDSNYLTATNVGAFIAAVSTPGFTVEMNQIQMWNVP